ncbi:unnamed protein product [Eruca vesicaria subsp. sativa]|uniref:Uncharacterized protein n=1 Tax=Eruca vesicaria subsp. sativa TaxID=29727 RepID=A0ABC8J2J3_ERUVS|nr:unnamed protein product [Eruca vesicaria subsp. sativa]
MSSKFSVSCCIYSFSSAFVVVDSSTRERSAKELSGSELVPLLVTLRLCCRLPSFSLSLCNLLKPDLSIDRLASSRHPLSPPLYFNLQRSPLNELSLWGSITSAMDFSVRSPDLVRSSSDPYTSTFPQSLTPHLPIVFVVKALTLTLIWKRRSLSGFIISASTLPFHHLFPTLACCLSLFITDTLNTEADPSRHGFYGAKVHSLNLILLVTAGFIVQECCFAKSAHDYIFSQRLNNITSSQASTVLHKARIPAFSLSSSMTLLCKSVDSPELQAISPLHFHHNTPSQASTVLYRVNYATFKPEW